MPGEEIFYLSVSELAKRIESKKLSPVDLTQLYLDRSQKFGSRFNAYAHLTPETALARAKAAEKEIQRGHYRGPLHGIPYAAKDLLAVKGLPTTWGAKPFANQVFDYNATVIEHLNSVGAVMLGKASMIELAGRHLPSARKHGDPSSARRHFAESAVCGLLTVVSVVTARWRSPLRWIRSAQWRGAPRTAHGSLPPSQAMILKIAELCP